MQYTISSKKAAHYFNVNESTVKRWADSGILKCFKTAGGHRKFKLSDLKKHAEENNFHTTNLLFVENEPKGKTVLIRRNYNDLNRNLEKYILNGDTVKTFDFLYTLYFNGYSIEEIFDRIVKITMQSIGEKWAAKTLSIENEHIATNTIISSLHQFERVIQKNKSNKKSVICAGLENEYHETGILCVKIALAAFGWNVIYPGINLPVENLSELILKNKPNLICLSTTYISDFENYEKKLNEIKKICDMSGTLLIIGGVNELSKKVSIPKCESISELKSVITKLENEF